MPLRYAVPSPPQLPGSLHRLVQDKSYRPPGISYLDALIKMGSESIDAIMRRRRILFAVFVARAEATRLPKCVTFGELVVGAGCVGGAGKRVDGVFPGRPQSFRYQRRPVDDCSSGRERMAQYGGTRREAERFMAKCIAAEKARAGLRPAVVCPNVTGRTKERIAQSKRARAGSLAIVDEPQAVRTCILRAFFVCRCHFAFLWRCVFFFFFFVLFDFILVFFGFIEPGALRSIVLRYACAPTATSSYLTTAICVLFCFSRGFPFFRVFLYHRRFLFVWKVR